MHYYQFNIGDYHSHTGYLSLMEDLAYRRLLDQYYLQEIPLPSDVKEIARKIGMSDYLEEVEQVLSDFFTPNDSGDYINKRVDEEIAQYRAKADTARVNGKKGGRPKKPNANPEETQQEPRKTQPVNLANPEEPTLVNYELGTTNHELQTTKDIPDKSVMFIAQNDFDLAIVMMLEVQKLYPSTNSPPDKIKSPKETSSST